MGLTMLQLKDVSRKRWGSTTSEKKKNGKSEPMEKRSEPIEK